MLYSSAIASYPGMIPAAMKTHTIEWIATIRIWAFRFQAGQLIGACGTWVSEVVMETSSRWVESSNRSFLMLLRAISSDRMAPAGETFSLILCGNCEIRAVMIKERDPIDLKYKPLRRNAQIYLEPCEKTRKGLILKLAGPHGEYFKTGLIPSASNTQNLRIYPVRNKHIVDLSKNSKSLNPMAHSHTYA